MKLHNPKTKKFSQLERIMAVWIGCKRCSLHLHRRNQVFFRGNEHAKILLIGEGPGVDEDEQGYPFVGRAGKVLDKALKAANLEKDVGITNMVICRPPENRVPTNVEMTCCAERLMMVVETIHPAVLVLLGGTAAHRLCGIKQVCNWRGKELLIEMTCSAISNISRYKGLVTWHPSFYLHSGYNPVVFNQMVLDLKHAVKMSRG